MNAGQGEQRFTITPPGKAVLVIPLLATMAALAGAGIALATAPDTPMPWPVWLALAMMPLLAGAILWDLFHRDVRVDHRGLRLRALPWPTTVPLAELAPERAEVVDLATRAELAPRWKLLGARLPGFLAGVFRLRDKRRATVLVTDRRRVLALPRHDGSLLLLSVQKPDALLQALRRRG